MLNDIGPGLSFLEVRHEPGCPTAVNQDWSECTCRDGDLEFERHFDERRFMASFNAGRKARRAAARAAEKAMRKARRTTR